MSLLTETLERLLGWEISAKDVIPVGSRVTLTKFRGMEPMTNVNATQPFEDITTQMSLTLTR